MTLETLETVTPKVPQPMTSIASANPRRVYVDLFIISFLVLFFELACIRWFGSTVVFLTFFTNIVLMACFLGMSVGCLAASQRRDFVKAVIPLALVSVALACVSLWAYNRFGRIVVDVGGQNSPQQVFFGTEYRAKDPGHFIIPIELVSGIFFALISLMFVGLGQVLGRAFNATPNRVASYTINILGSLVGIVAFGLASYFRTAPIVWFAISIGLILYFVRPWSMTQLACQIALLGVIGYVSYNETKWTQSIGRQIFWSPYYKIQYDQKGGSITTNNIGHQNMMKVSQSGPGYSLPHLLNRDAGRPPFEDVLIIGAGSGNDVQCALSNGAKHIDAVEIDPVLNEIGRANHPDRPYDDERVTIHLDDGRSFVHKTERKYDLAIYALVDSLILHSGYSSLRLESFLFTEQAFRAIKAKLKPGGVFAMYNSYRQGWVVGRLAKMAEKVFGTKPIVLSLPYRESISPSDRLVSHFVLLLVGESATSPVEAIRRAFEERESFWVNEVPRLNKTINAYGPVPPTFADTAVDTWKRTRARRDRHDRYQPAADRRLALPLSTRGCHPRPQHPGHGDGGGHLASDSPIVRPSSHGPPQWPDVLPGCRLHAAGDQGRRPHGAFVRLDLGDKLDRFLRHPGDDLAEQPVRAVGPAPEDVVVLRVADRLAAGEHLRAHGVFPHAAGTEPGNRLVCDHLRPDLLRGSHIRGGVSR